MIEFETNRNNLGHRLDMVAASMRFKVTKREIEMSLPNVSARVLVQQQIPKMICSVKGRGECPS